MEENEVLGIGSRVKHKEYGPGVVIQVKSASYLITFMEHGNREISRTYKELEVIDLLVQPDDLVSLETIEYSLIKILRTFSDIQETVPIADKWAGGTLILKPSNPELKPYEMPISTFFNKIIMIRDRLRVLEQKINTSNISEEEKITLQQYITRSYGSLTSFNILFKYKTHSFIGEGSKDK
ncbi:hypothetical protein M2459_003118 [Parabacteroides sp. PF5-5]|uniref:hypothetical protein n=1 Tax=unclassified Parabacteroides TaxID=2649774 RepID=UPI002475E41C|nr:MULTISPECIES: hypothetical protein [unclassified Parabacteroides]MDH6305908.1 hypothetical protein [Parabacteroides sp. PH5-39]MDH6317279.1 hypothetical protein [Parabacteroides sp. PF5-13]MDH6320487.1 hypothetical protein [Parabacteroides sp. PH5-13]MDH6324351.1 hypothetical protein [Parabacteroides sp. PH5-8]MDH6328547.1 hypothetical protein [Parabacteroides sp. PH5-41]